MLILPAFLQQGRSDFDREAAAFLAELSDIAYGEREQAFTALVARGAKEATFFSKHNTHCVLVDFGSFRVVAFRGAEAHETKGVIAALKGNRCKLSAGGISKNGITVHGGFMAAVDRIWDALYPKIASQNSPLYITGHGLGGALGVLLAGMRIARETKSPIKDNLAAVYSFGCPKIGNAAFANFIKSPVGIRHHRVVNSTDIVALLPFPSPRYRHAGELHYIDGNGEIHSEIGRLDQFKDQVCTILNSLADGDGFKGWLPWQLYAAHSIGVYFRRLRE
ncbi:lipase family protein [Kiloniella majae]|uniref:lipase family protein n=1 Tax=Kiloniella majae TaxID=1938558 RepID=UPI000A2785E5|nr:hypothetical protein [Kiloniella majae]